MAESFIKPFAIECAKLKKIMTGNKEETEDDFKEDATRKTKSICQK